MAKYRKKHVVIEAWEYTGKNGFLLEQWGNGFIDAMNYPEGIIKIDTLEGVMTAITGDYIIKGVKGEFYPCKPDIFKITYELVKEK